MGKMLTYITILIFIDILFLVTAQFAITSPTSIIVNAINDITTLKTSNWFTVLVSGLAALLIAVAVIPGNLTRPSDIAIFFAMAVGLSVLIGDWVSIAGYLLSINTVFATIVMAPVIILFTFVIIEWARGKD